MCSSDLGIDDKVGSIEVGKSADLALFDQDPLSNYSKCLRVWIDGYEYFDRDRDLETRQKFNDQKKQLLEKENTPPAGQRTGHPGGGTRATTPMEESR